jgi:hypothetical protein
MTKTNPKNRFWGHPCPRGHSRYLADGRYCAERYRSDSRCCECAKLKQERYEAALKKRRGPTKRQLVVLARKKARQAGRTFYWGANCKYGHSGKRIVSTRACAHPDCIARYRHPPLHTLPRREHERILKMARDRDRQARRAVKILRELGLPAVEI